MKLSEKVALVTGGSSGLGAAVAIRFASEGARVAVLASSDTAKSQAVADKIAADGGTAKAFAADVRDVGAVARLVEDVKGAFSRIDILVNAAGVFYPTPAGETDPDAADRMFDVNLKGTWNAINAVVPLMKEQGGGKIVNFSSVAGVMGMPGYGLYCATKAAIVNLTKALAIELAPQNINVNAIAPGNTSTPMNEDIRTDPEMKPVYEFMESRTPSNRVYSTAEEMAGVALLLASEDGRAMHGSTVVIDEGVSAGMI